MPLPDLHRAEPIPPEAGPEIARLLQDADLFRYTAPAAAPVTLLEDEFAALMGSRFALAVSSCSAALFLSLKALGLPEGARVLIPGFTFAAVPSAVIHAGMTPVLCEVGENYRIDLEDFTALLPDIDAVLVSHMRGHTSDMDAILSACAARDIPVVEDAAHSLGTLWNGRKIGTLGRVGCFSFQSYKMINAGEGGILITDDADLVARAVIMSGAYEHNWKKHSVLHDAFAKVQNQLPLYNMRMSNLAAAVIRPQLPHLARRVADGRRNHDAMADLLTQSPQISVPAPLPGEDRAPDSIQFTLRDMDDATVQRFVDLAGARGVKLQVFGLSRDNARAFWNWQFLPETRDLPRTRAMLMRACDLRLPVQLSMDQIETVAAVVRGSLADATRQADAA